MNKHYHFSGICGTAMAGLAVMLKMQGYRVSGSDQNVYPPMSDYLAQHGIAIAKGYHEQNLVPHPDLVVIGNALSRGNPEVEYCLRHRLRYVSLAETLKERCLRGNMPVVITGTHGKTTTASLTAHLFEACGQAPGFMIGGALGNFAVFARPVQKAGGYFILEGDEYDTAFFDKRSKFFHYMPEVLIINNVEFDHADIFADLESIKTAFRLMLRQVPDNGIILYNGDDPVATEIVASAYSQVISFGMGAHCEARLADISLDRQSDRVGIRFSLTYRGQRTEWAVPLLGEMNARNAAAAILAALSQGLAVADIAVGLQSFINTRRRLELLTPRESAVCVIDDFAHHPTAIGATILALRQSLQADRRIIAIYQPTSNTSVRRYHQATLAPAFQAADMVFFAQPHRAASIAAEDLLDLESVCTELRGQSIPAYYEQELGRLFAAIVQEVREGDTLLVMSQGAFGGLAHRLAEHYSPAVR